MANENESNKTALNFNPMKMIDEICSLNYQILTSLEQSKVALERGTSYRLFDDDGLVDKYEDLSISVSQAKLDAASELREQIFSNYCAQLEIMAKTLPTKCMLIADGLLEYFKDEYSLADDTTFEQIVCDGSIINKQIAEDYAKYITNPTPTESNKGLAHLRDYLKLWELSINFMGAYSLIKAYYDDFTSRGFKSIYYQNPTDNDVHCVDPSTFDRLRQRVDAEKNKLQSLIDKHNKLQDEVRAYQSKKWNNLERDVLLKEELDELNASDDLIDGHEMAESNLTYRLSRLKTLSNVLDNIEQRKKASNTLPLTKSQGLQIKIVDVLNGLSHIKPKVDKIYVSDEELYLISVASADFENLTQCAYQTLNPILSDGEEIEK